MKSKILPVIAHPKHITFGWYSNYLTLLSKCALKRGYAIDVVYNTKDLSRFEGEDYVIVIGIENEWLEEVFDYLDAMGMRGIVECGSSKRNSLFEITVDVQSIIRQSIQLFHNNGREKVALFGVKNYDASDKIKIDTFCSENPEYEDEDIYYTNYNIEECFDAFCKNAHKYNAVICADDIVGVYFISACKKVGIRIPEDMYVTGNGNTRLRTFCKPTLTSFANALSYDNSHPDVIIKIYDLLVKYPQIGFLKMGGTALAIEGESTNAETTKASKRRIVDFSESEIMEINNIRDRNVRDLCVINRALDTFDDVDIGILSMQLAGESYVKTAAALYISVDTVKYRMKRIYKNLRVSNKMEMLELINRYDLNI